MYYLKCNILVFLTIVALQTVASDVADNRKDKVDPTFVSLPINSKFWNPQLDDKANMELIGVHFPGDSNETVAEVSDKRTRFSGRTDLNNDEQNLIGKRGQRYFAWGLFNLLRPMSWTDGLQDANLRRQPKTFSKGAN